MIEKALVIKFGGSEATGMEGARVGYLYDFLNSIGSDLLDSYAHIGLVIGGGPRVRALQETVEGDSAKNLIAREAMWEHAETLGEVARSLGLGTVANVPHSPEEMNHILDRDFSKVMVMSWLKDHQSSDASSVLLIDRWVRELYDAQIAILSNVAHIFTANPNEDPGARAISRSNLRRLVEEGVLIDDPAKFVPGGHVVIDSVAVAKLSESHNRKLPLYFGHGNDSRSVATFMVGGEPRTGTILSDKYPKTEYARG